LRFTFQRRAFSQEEKEKKKGIEKKTKRRRRKRDIYSIFLSFTAGRAVGQKKKKERRKRGGGDIFASNSTFLTVYSEWRAATATGEKRKRKKEKWKVVVRRCTGGSGRSLLLSSVIPAELPPLRRKKGKGKEREEGGEPRKGEKPALSDRFAHIAE